MEIQQICSLLEIDWQACVSRFSGNEGLYRRFLFRFPQDETWEQLVRAWEQQDIPGVERGAHTLKGIAANLGLARLQADSAAVVDAVRAGRTEELPALMEQLTASCRLACEILSQPVD